MFMNRREALARMTAVGAILLARPALVYAARKPFTHPEPRPGITGEHVLTHEQLGKRSKKVYDAYDAARAHPEIFDGIYCSCDCAKGNNGHRSLLACYESMQPTGCGTCQEDGDFVGKLAVEGKSLTEIRAAYDKEYG